MNALAISQAQERVSFSLCRLRQLLTAENTKQCSEAASRRNQVASGTHSVLWASVKHLNLLDVDPSLAYWIF